MKKAERIQHDLHSFHELAAKKGLPTEYFAYFHCFNKMEYYDAHDYLEHLWLQSSPPQYGFYKGMIQLAGAFVHLQKQFLRPTHHKDGRRLHPAYRLFLLAQNNLQPLPSPFLGMPLHPVYKIILHYSLTLKNTHFSQNPWHPNFPPQLPFPDPILP